MAAATVQSHDVDLHARPFPHLRDVADVDHRAVHFLDREVVEVEDGVRAAVEPHAVFSAADLGRARREHDVLRRESAADVGRR